MNRQPRNRPLWPIELSTVGVERFGPVLRIRLRTDLDWLHAYLDTETYSLVIVGGWGTWAYRWSDPGSHFESFILDRTRDHQWRYITSKLFIDSAVKSTDRDDFRMKSALRKQPARAYRTKSHDDFDSLSDCNVAYCEAVAVVADTSTDEVLYGHEDLIPFIDVEPSDYCECDSVAYRRMSEQLLPALSKAWRAWRAANES